MSPSSDIGNNKSVKDLPPDVRLWTTQHVSLFLSSVEDGRGGISSSISTLFSEQGIDGVVLLTLTEDDLRDPPLRIAKLGDIKKLSLMIRKIQDEQREFEETHHRHYVRKMSTTSSTSSRKRRETPSSPEQPSRTIDTTTKQRTSDGKVELSSSTGHNSNNAMHSSVNKERTRRLTQDSTESVVGDLFYSSEDEHDEYGQQQQYHLRKHNDKHSDSEEEGDRGSLLLLRRRKRTYPSRNYVSINNNGHNRSFLHPSSSSSFNSTHKLKPEAWKALLAMAYFFLVTLITAFVMVFVHDRVPDMATYPPLPDIFLDNVPLIPWAFQMCEFCGCILFSIWFLILVFHRHRFILLRRMFSLFGSVFLLRCVTMLITSLSVPGKHLECKARPYGTWSERVHQAYLIWSGGGMSLQGVRTCGDYMFSGHTVVLTLLNFFITEYTPPSMHFVHTTSWVLNLFGIFFILAGHEHYSIDVFIAFYISTRLFLYYHTLANNRALYQPDRKRTKVWFPLFSFFESGVKDMVPNEYDNLSDHVIRVERIIKRWVGRIKDEGVKTKKMMEESDTLRDWKSRVVNAISSGVGGKYRQQESKGRSS